LYGGLYIRAGRLTAKNGCSRPGQYHIFYHITAGDLAPLGDPSLALAPAASYAQLSQSGCYEVCRSFGVPSV
jgi:hypothetical protein